MNTITPITDVARLHPEYPDYQAFTVRWKNLQLAIICLTYCVHPC